MFSLLMSLSFDVYLVSPDGRVGVWVGRCLLVGGCVWMWPMLWRDWCVRACTRVRVGKWLYVHACRFESVCVCVCVFVCVCTCACVHMDGSVGLCGRARLSFAFCYFLMLPVVRSHCVNKKYRRVMYAVAAMQITSSCFVLATTAIPRMNGDI